MWLIPFLAAVVESRHVVTGNEANAGDGEPVERYANRAGGGGEPAIWPYYTPGNCKSQSLDVGSGFTLRYAQGLPRAIMKE